MTDTTSSRAPGRECPRCAEPVLVSMETAIPCGFCGHLVRPRKTPLVRLAEVASLAAALAFVIAVCRVLGHLIAV